MDGAFSFDYTPDVIGDVKGSLRCSGAAFIMEDAELQFTVTEVQQEPDQSSDQNQDQDQTEDSQDTGIPIEFVIVAVIVVVAVLIAFIAYMVIKKRDTSSPIVISD
jgi:flagellar biosynthesis/type III secretory pathway M-ring protein FliF/YscJ